MPSATAVGEHTQLEAQRIRFGAGELLQVAHIVHAEEQSVVAALLDELRSRSLYGESLRRSLQDADMTHQRTGGQ